ncbi:hypothetical protein O3M35_004238 [Rhynocoris fuscipes]|uniref:Uncharacterized protein n=1 Tax=Rhynocoris fuscipes TaxID=488301 RepID=A0AAW1CGU0_9HEMI
MSSKRKSPPSKLQEGSEEEGSETKLTSCDNKGQPLNNNSTTVNHNQAGPKRTMDDVLKRLTSKMNNSTIKEEKSPSAVT